MITLHINNTTLHIEVHKFWCNPQQPIQSIGCEFPCKQETNTAFLPIVLTFAPISQLLQKLWSNMSSYKLSRVGPAFRPVNPSQTSIGIPLPKSHTYKCWQIMFVSITRTLAIILIYRKIFSVWDNFNCKISIDLKPLGAFSPLLEFDHWVHLTVVPASSDRTR